MIRDEIKATILFSKPEIEIYSHGRFSLYCEVDLFNEHIMYFVRVYETEMKKKFYDYEFHTDFEKAIDEFIKMIGEAKNGN